MYSRIHSSDCMRAAESVASDPLGHHADEGLYPGHILPDQAQTGWSKRASTELSIMLTSGTPHPKSPKSNSEPLAAQQSYSRVLPA